MAHGNWRKLADGPDSRALLAVDFGPGRPAASFADLVARLAPRPQAWESVFAPARDPIANTDPDALVARWMADVRDAGLAEVHGVLGYCSGAALACRLADALRQAGCGAPAVVLLDPAGVDGGLIYDLFASSVRTYAELLGEQRCRAALDAGAAATAGLGVDISLVAPPVLADAMRALQGQYDAVVDAACEVLEAGGEVQQGFSDRFASFLAYLVTAGRAAVGSLGERVTPTVYGSRNHQPSQPFARIDRRFPVARADLLADPSVADAVARAIAEHCPA